MILRFIKTLNYVLFILSTEKPMPLCRIIRAEDMRDSGRYVEKTFWKDGNSKHQPDFTNRFVSAIDEDYGKSESMRRFMISRYNAVVNFGRDSGLIPKGVKIALPPYYLLPAN